jgi:hypothetical protein
MPSKKVKVKERLCLLCEKYIPIKNWKKHLPICEKKFKKERNII